MDDVLNDKCEKSALDVLEAHVSSIDDRVGYTWLFTWCGHTRMRWISQSDEAIRLGGTSP